MMTCSNIEAYVALIEAIGEGEGFNAAKHSYESRTPFPEVMRQVKLGESIGLLLPGSGFEFLVDRSKIIPDKIGEVTAERFANMLDDCTTKILEHIFDCGGKSTKESILDDAPTFRKSRYESALDMLKSRRILTESGGRISANITKEVYEMIRKVYK